MRLKLDDDCEVSRVRWLYIFFWGHAYVLLQSDGFEGHWKHESFHGVHNLLLSLNTFFSSCFRTEEPSLRLGLAYTRSDLLWFCVEDVAHIECLDHLSWI